MLVSKLNKCFHASIASFYFIEIYFFVALQNGFLKIKLFCKKKMKRWTEMQL